MLQARPHLLCAWRSKNGTGDTCRKETIAYESCETRFVAGTAATDDGNVVRLGKRRGVAIDNLVGSVEQERWVGESKGVEGGEDGVGGISEVVLCCWGEMSALGQSG